MKEKKGRHTKTQRKKHNGLLSFQVKKQLFLKIKKIYSMLAEKVLSRKEKGQSSKYWSNLDEMPLYNFVKCLCDKDYSYLYKVKPPRKRIEVYEQIYFANLIFDYNNILSDGNASLKELITHSILLSNIRILESCLFSFPDISNTENEALRKIGVKLTGNQKDILLILSKKDNLIRKYKDLQRKNAPEEVNSNQFVKTLSVISTHFKMHLNIYDITVSGYCNYYLQYVQEMKLIKKAHGNRKY